MKIWRTKIFLKILLSRLPFNYRFWSKIGFFRHGAMDDYTYVWKVLSLHTSFLRGTNNWKGLELGPGDGVLSSLLAPALGSSGLTLVDAGNFAQKDINKYHNQINKFKKDFPDKSLPDYDKTSCLEEMLIMANGEYNSEGLASLRNLKSKSFDLIYSQAVLEHIQRNEFKETLVEMPSIVKTRWCYEPCS